MRKKQAIKGFSGLHIGKLLKNSSTEYEVGEMEELIGAQSAVLDKQGDDYEVPGDDGMYDDGIDFKRVNLVIKVAELPLELQAKLEGAKYDTDTGVYVWGPSAVPPEIALTFRGAMLGGGWRVLRYYRAVVKDIKVDFNTRGSGGDISSYTLTVSATTRRVDGETLDQKDVNTPAESMQLLRNIPKIPAEPAGE